MEPVVTPYFPHLFSPFQLGSITLPNRLVMAPHGVVFAGGYGSSTDRVVDYHIERAKGGVGLIVMSNFLMPASWRAMASWGGNLATTPLGNLDLANDEAMMPAYRRLIEGVHAHGTKFISQLNASGRQLHPPGAVSFGLPLFAPSALPCAKLKEIPKEMTAGEIAEYVQTFADASVLMQGAGADGVEIFAAQGYLLSEFLSPNANLRSDVYGGSLENRMRFLSEIIVAIRARVGRGFVLGVRLNADDFEVGGVNLPMAIDIARALAATGQIDYLNVSGMTASLYPAWIADISAPEAQFATLAGQIRAAVPGMPVCVVSRIESAEQGEAVLVAGQADMVGMARPLISDPELPNKSKAGHSEDVRKCTYSNQACVMGLDRGRGVGCVHNVAVGREAQLGIGTMRPAPRAKKVAVVGGGPAGMAAARVAAERGHAVTLFEKSARLGGQNLMTAAVQSRRGLHEVTRWQEHMLRKGPVDLRLATEVSAEDILGMAFDAVVLATGSVPQTDGHSTYRDAGEELVGVNLPHVFTTWDVFTRLEDIGQRVVVLEEDPHGAGTAVAEHLSDQGRSVQVVSPNTHSGSQLHIYHVPDLYRRFGQKGIQVHPHTIALAVEKARLLCRDRFTGVRWAVDNIDAVVLATGNRSNDSLYRALLSRHPEVHVIGDCVAPRQLDQAIVDGERVGWML
ncbi:MAG: FAD-dependent oxidoreductase [Comamonadaceae bacterium]|nr:MAG: FAD-dependent oxidoreductase [Comamonadaceae bacterium]